MAIRAHRVLAAVLAHEGLLVERVGGLARERVAEREEVVLVEQVVGGLDDVGGRGAELRFKRKV